MIEVKDGFVQHLRLWNSCRWRFSESTLGANRLKIEELEKAEKQPS